MTRTSPLLTAAALIALCALAAGSARALPLVLDYEGFAWVSPGLLPIHLASVGQVDGFSIPVNDPDEVYTYYLSDLNLSEVINYSGSRHMYIYSGGAFTVYRSTDESNRGYDYGTYPVNPTSPSTFTDGVTWLSGNLDNFSLLFDDTLQLGTLSAEGLFSSGEMIDQLETPSFFTFSGVTARPGDNIPPGYRYRYDGQTGVTLDTVPEPTAALLLALGLLGFGVTRQLRRRIS